MRSTGNFGLYLGVWGSNTAFSVNSTIEIDYYVGFANAIGGLGYDAMLAYYTYPGAEDEDSGSITGGKEIDYFEFNLGLSYTLPSLGPVTPTVSAGYDFSPEYYGEDGTSNNVDFALALAFDAGPLPITVDGLYGWMDVEGDNQTGNGFGMDGGDGFDYTYYQVGIGTELVGFGLDIRYHATDSDMEAYYGDIADPRVTFTVSRSM